MDVAIEQLKGLIFFFLKSRDGFENNIIYVEEIVSVMDVEPKFVKNVLCVKK